MNPETDSGIVYQIDTISRSASTCAHAIKAIRETMAPGLRPSSFYDWYESEPGFEYGKLKVELNTSKRAKTLSLILFYKQEKKYKCKTLVGIAPRYRKKGELDLGWIMREYKLFYAFCKQAFEGHFTCVNPLILRLVHFLFDKNVQRPVLTEEEKKFIQSLSVRALKKLSRNKVHVHNLRNKLGNLLVDVSDFPLLYSKKEIASFWRSNKVYTKYFMLVINADLTRLAIKAITKIEFDINGKQVR